MHVNAQSHFLRVRRRIICVACAFVFVVLAAAGLRFHSDLRSAQASQEWMQWRDANCSAVSGAERRTAGSVYEASMTHGQPGTWKCGPEVYKLPNSDVPPMNWRARR